MSKQTLRALVRADLATSLRDIPADLVEHRVSQALQCPGCMAYYVELAKVRGKRMAR